MTSCPPVLTVTRSNLHAQRTAIVSSVEVEYSDTATNEFDHFLDLTNQQASLKVLKIPGGPRLVEADFRGEVARWT